MEKALLETLKMEERDKTARLTAITTIRSCDGALKVIEETVEKLIEDFKQRPPTDQQKRRLLILNQTHGNAAVDLVEVKMMAAADSGDEEIWISGTRAQRRKKMRSSMRARKKAKAVAQRVKEAYADCEALRMEVEAE